MRTLGLLLCLLCGAPALADEGALRHKIVSEDGAGQERTIAVRIDQRAPEADIKALAFTLRDKAKPGKAPAVVRFYLSAMALSDAPWAVMRFHEGAHLDISGLRHEEVQAFTAEAAADTRDIQGVWLTSAPALPGKLTIWRTSKGQRFAEWHLRTGKKTIDELIELQISSDPRRGAAEEFPLDVILTPQLLGAYRRTFSSGRRNADARLTAAMLRRLLWRAHDQTIACSCRFTSYLSSGACAACDKPFDDALTLEVRASSTAVPAACIALSNGATTVERRHLPMPVEPRSRHDEVLQARVERGRAVLDPAPEWSCTPASIAVGGEALLEHESGAVLTLGAVPHAR